jgi:hypothetical protein
MVCGLTSNWVSPKSAMIGKECPVCSAAEQSTDLGHETNEHPPG